MRVQVCGWEKPTAEELLNPCPVVADLRATAEREVYEVNPVGVEDGKGFGTTLGACAWICGMVTKLEDMTSLSER